MVDKKKKRNLTLHIGTEKTGTTSIQNFLDINYLNLKEQGISIPRSLCYSESFNHRWAAIIAYNKNRNDDNTKDLFKSQEDRSKQIQEKIKEFKSEVNSDPSNSWIISSEHLQSRLSTKEEINRLKIILSSLFEDIKILIYLRDPIETAISWWSTKIKSEGVLYNLPEPIHPYINQLCNHKQSIQNWSSIFKKENIMVGIYEDREVERNIVLDFCKKLNIDFGSLDQNKDFDNKKLSFLGMKYKAHLNKIISTSNKKKDSEYIKLLIKKIFEYTSNDPLYLPTQIEINNYKQTFFSSNDWIKKELFPSKDILWGGQKKSSKNEKITLNLSQSEKKLFNIIFDLIDELNTISKYNFNKIYLQQLAEYDAVLKRISIFSFWNQLKIKYNKKILRIMVFLNKNYKKLLLK